MVCTVQCLPTASVPTHMFSQLSGGDVFGSSNLLKALRQTNASASQTAEEIAATVDALKTRLIEQGQRNEERSLKVQQAIATEATQLDAHIAKLTDELAALNQDSDLTENRFKQLNKQLFGYENPDASLSAGVLPLLGSAQLDPATQSPRTLPNAGDGSVLQVLKIVWQQLVTLHENCLIDSPAHSVRGGPRADLEAVDFVLREVTHSSDPSEFDPGCPFCNQTVFRSIVRSCLIERPLSLVPIQLQPDMAKCWTAIDLYCLQLPGSKDPGCACAASERCWGDGPFIGRCPARGDDGSRVCTQLPELQCHDFFAGEIAKLFDSPTYSVADEILVNKLRDLRRRLTVAPQPVGAELSQHCTADHAALMRHFERVESIAATLWKRRAELATDTAALQSMTQAKKDLLNSATEAKSDVLTRMAQETHAMIERRSSLNSELVALDSALSVLSKLHGSSTTRQIMSRVAASKEGAMQSCQQLKRTHPSLPSGVYWVTLGKGAEEAVRVYCDMTTDGGGWTLVWKNVGGAVLESARTQHASNAELLAATDRNEIVTPTDTDRRAQIHHAAYSYFASRPNTQWLKHMTLFRGRSDEFASQRILVELGDIHMANIFATPEGCRFLNTAIRLYTSRNESSATDYYIGSTHTVINRQKESFGLANIGSVDDMCLAENAPPPNVSDVCDASMGSPRVGVNASNSLVCDFQMLRTLSASGNLTVAGAWNMIRHLFSYVHHSPTPREANRCMYRCWESNDDILYNDVFVWAVRGKCPEHDGLECSSHGECNDGICQCAPGYFGNACEQRIACTSLNGTSDPHGIVRCSGYKFDDVCSVSCDLGYVIAGPNPIRCLYGQWSSEISQCVPRSCPAFNSSVLGPNAVVKCTGSEFQDACNVSCSIGFRLTGGDSAVCTARGQWSWGENAVARCQPIVCEPLTTPSYGTQSCDDDPSRIGTRCVFDCLPNYILTNGSQVRTCQVSGEYSGSNVLCSPLSCQPLTVDSDVILECPRKPNTGFAEGEACSFSCPPNFALKGSPSAVCASNGVWSMDAAPSCQVIDPCQEIVCPASVPTCEFGKFVAPQSQWRGCCFDPDTDCDEFEQYVVVTLQFPLSFSSDTADGVVNTNALRAAIASIANLRHTDVIAIYTFPTLAGDAIDLAVLPSSDSSLQHNVSAIVDVLTDALLTHPQRILEALAVLDVPVDTFTVVSPPAAVARIPLHNARFIEFTDEDGRPGWVSGDMIIHRPLERDNDTIRYAVYFGDGQGTARDNRVGDAIASGDIDISTDAPYVSLYIPPTLVPPTVHTWLIFSVGPFAEAQTGYSSELIDLVRVKPNVFNGSLSFADEDERTGWIRGSIVVNVTSVPANTTSYVVYFGNGGTAQDAKIGGVIAEGVVTGKSTEMIIPTSIPVPDGATHLLAFARDVDIEADEGIIARIVNLPTLAHAA